MRLNATVNLFMSVYGYVFQTWVNLFIIEAHELDNTIGVWVRWAVIFNIVCIKELSVMVLNDI